jgi:choline dehydrogenase-like flavoprotein
MYFPFITAKSLAGFGEKHSSFMRAYPRLQMILVLACDHAVDSNRVAIDAVGRPVVHYQFTSEVTRALVRGAVASARIFFAAGARRVHLPMAQPALVEKKDAARLDRIAEEAPFQLGKVTVSAAHLQGGCGMGRTDADSVTDPFGRVHGIPWLRVADASLFPNSVEINPYLTIMSLADRVAEKVREEVGSL